MNKTPKVIFNFNQGTLKITGRSTLLNPGEYYQKIIVVLTAYCQQPQKESHLIIDLEYYNTRSARYLLLITKLMVNIKHTHHTEVIITWFYDRGDQSQLEEIKLFSEIIQHPIKSIASEIA